MTQFLRDRDCIILKKGDSLPVSITSAMAAGGWPGGQGVQWVDSPKDIFLVNYSDGPFGGFIFYGSTEPSDKFPSTVGQQLVYGYSVLAFGSWVVATSTYERYTYASRQAGPLVPITYQPQDRLRFSLRGYWTKEDEWTLSGDPRAPNNLFCAITVQVPSAETNHYLTLQTIM